MGSKTPSLGGRPSGLRPFFPFLCHGRLGPRAARGDGVGALGLGSGRGSPGVCPPASPVRWETFECNPSIDQIRPSDKCGAWVGSAGPSFPLVLSRWFPMAKYGLLVYVP